MSTHILPNSDERIFAALAHGSVLFSFIGPIGPMIVWLTQRGRSRYSSFHALQAMGFQVISFWLWIFLSILFPFLLLFFMLIGIFAFDSADNFEFFPIAFQGVLFAGLFGAWGLYFLMGLVGAGFALAGKDFRYPVLGKWLEKYLEANENETNIFDEERESSWVAAVCHATSIILMWGLAVPAVVWISQRNRSIKLSFQAAQATIYQTIALVVYIIGSVVYMLLAFGLLATLFVGGVSTPEMQTEMPAEFGTIFIVFMAFIGLLWLVSLIATPTYFIISGFATFRTLQGGEYRYPVIGRFIARRMNYAASSQVENLEE